MESVGRKKGSSVALIATAKSGRKKTWVVVCRRDYSMRRLELTGAGHDLLADLVSGSALGDAVSTAIRRGARHGLSGEQIYRWFREWTAAGCFRSPAV